MSRWGGVHGTMGDDSLSGRTRIHGHRPPQDLFDPVPHTVTRPEYYRLNGLPCPDRACGSLPAPDAEIRTSPLEP